jgi:hypothetical protein
VGHLQEHPVKYPEAIRQFLYDVYFSNLKIKLYYIEHFSRHLVSDNDRERITAFGKNQQMSFIALKIVLSLY